MTEQTQTQEKTKKEPSGSNKTPKSLWRSKRGDQHHATWLKQLDVYLDKVNPKIRHAGGRR